MRSTIRRAFTLVELLMVLAILAVLAALLFPIFGAVRARARRTVCLSNLRQIGQAVALYRNDYDAWPPQLSFVNADYGREPRIFLCPSDRRQGQHVGNARLEGNLYLPSGVSYTYVPRWERAQELGWWEPAPDFGQGHWNDLTPLAECHWHWATQFHADWERDRPSARGWVVTLLAGGSVRLYRVERPPEQFTP